MNEKITLEKIEGFSVYGSNGNESNNELFGFYKDKSNAKLASKNIGFFGSEGSVYTEIIYTDGKNFYDLVKLKFDHFNDDQAEFITNQLDDLMKKLSPEELEFIKKHYSTVIVNKK